jgi:hypothetical protein
MPGDLGKVTKSKGKGGKPAKTVYASDKFGIFEDGGILHITTLEAGGHRGLTQKDGLIYWMLKTIYEKGLNDPDR